MKGKPSNPFGEYLDPARMLEAIRLVVAASRREGQIVALCGGAAMQLYGSDRLTKDVDFVASGQLLSLKLKKKLAFGGRSGKVAGVEVDLIVRDDDYADLYQQALETARASSDVGCEVVTPPYLVAMKLAARRTKDELDIKNLIARQAVDLHTTKHVIRRHLGRFAVDEFESYVQEVQLMGRSE